MNIFKDNKTFKKFKDYSFAMIDEMKLDKDMKQKANVDIKYFEFFDSKVGITYDVWDSDGDLFTETNKKV